MRSGRAIAAKRDSRADQDSLVFFDSSRGGFGVVPKTAPKTIPTTASGIPAKTSTPSIVFTPGDVTPKKSVEPPGVEALTFLA